MKIYSSDSKKVKNAKNRIAVNENWRKEHMRRARERSEDIKRDKAIIAREMVAR